MGRRKAPPAPVMVECPECGTGEVQAECYGCGVALTTANQAEGMQLDCCAECWREDEERS